MAAEYQEIIRNEVDEPLARIADISLVGENLIRYNSIINDVSHAAREKGNS